MKILHCIGSFNFGGIERLVYELSKLQLTRSDVEVSILVTKNEGEFKKDFENLSLEIITSTFSSGYDVNPVKIHRSYQKLKGFDVIHIHTFHAAMIFSALMTKAKLVYTEHGNFGFGRKTTRIDQINFLARKIFFNSFKVSICANSCFTKQYLEQHFYQGNKNHVVLNGVTLNHQIEEPLVQQLTEKYKDKFVIGTTSRLAGFKKVDRLIHVFSKYIQFNKNAFLIIVGDGLQRKELEKLVEDLNIKPFVAFVGFQKQVATYQSIFDVCVFPSKNEPFGLVAVECLSLKKPVLVFKDGGGLCEIIEKFTPQDICDDAQEMVERLQYYADNQLNWTPDFDNQLQYFSNQRMERDYYKMYTKIASLCVG